MEIKNNLQGINSRVDEAKNQIIYLDIGSKNNQNGKMKKECKNMRVV